MAWDKTAPFYKEDSCYEIEGVQHLRWRKGDMLDYASPWTRTYRPDLVDYDLLPFTKQMALKYDGYGRGRSSITFWWRDVETGNRYPMFLTDFDDLMRDLRIGPVLLAEDETTTGVVGTFTACKRGQNYGIRRVDAAE